MNTKKKNAEKQPMKYWLVEFTLTSGKILTNYVKAINIHEAYKIADDYAVLAENEKLRKHLEVFRLLP